MTGEGSKELREEGEEEGVVMCPISRNDVAYWPDSLCFHLHIS